MRLIMIRHPKTEANERKLVYGWTDSLYSEAGKATIPGIVRGLHDVKIDRIYSSPLTRTRLLAEAIAADHGPAAPDQPTGCAAPDIVIDDRIKEMNFGKFENMTIPELEEKYPVEFSEYRKNFNDCIVPGGESFRQLSERTVAFLQDIYDRHEKGIDYCKDDDGWPAQGTVGEKKKEETIVVVSHSMVIHAAIGYLMGFDLDDVWRVKVEPGSMIDFGWRYDYAMLQSLNGPFNVRKP